MTQEVDSAALSLADRSYGLSGVDAEQNTFVDDGVLNQVREMNPIARRSRVPFQGGIFYARLENDHPGAGTLESFVDLYNPVFVSNGYPSAVDPALFDVWILGATCRASVGANVTVGMIGRNNQGLRQGPSDTAAGGIITPGNFRDIWGIWDDFSLTDQVGTEFGMNALNGLFQIPMNRRLSAGDQMLFRSTATGATITKAVLHCFIGPIALGQDLW